MEQLTPCRKVAPSALDELVRAAADTSELYMVLTPALSFIGPPSLLDTALSALVRPIIEAPSAEPPAARLAFALPDIIAHADLLVLGKLDDAQSRIAAGLGAPSTRPSAAHPEEAALRALEEAACLQSARLDPEATARIATELSDQNLHGAGRVAREFIGAQPDLLVTAEHAARQLTARLPEHPFPLIRSALHLHVASMWLWLLYTVPAELTWEPTTAPVLHRRY